VYSQLGICQYKNKDYKGAAESLTQAVNAGSGTKEVFLYKGYSEFQQKDNDNALKDLEKAVALGANEAEAYKNMGDIRFLKNDFRGDRTMTTPKAGSNDAVLFNNRGK
jgi:Flp pilus assembly protein TadD